MSGWRHTAELSVGAGQITAAEVKAHAAQPSPAHSPNPTHCFPSRPFRFATAAAQVDLQRSQQDVFLMTRMLQAFDLFQQVNPPRRDAPRCAALRCAPLAARG